MPGPPESGITGAGGSSGGGACKRSMTDFATSAAERIVSGAGFARGFGVRLGWAFALGFGFGFDFTAGLV